MNITEQFDIIIKAKYSPGDQFHIRDIYRISYENGITYVESTIQRAMQEVRDRETIEFVDYNGTYRRLCVGKESEENRNANIKQLIKYVKNGFWGVDIANVFARDRLWQLLNQKEEDTRIIEDMQKIEKDYSVSTDRWDMVCTRLGQGEFRKKLIKYWKKCAVTGCELTQVLKASHIKPWRNSINEERLDLYNGLLLMPNIDSLFDLGFITINDDGTIKKSIVFKLFKTKPLIIPDNARISIDEKHLKYIFYHRKNIFLDS